MIDENLSELEAHNVYDLYSSTYGNHFTRFHYIYDQLKYTIISQKPKISGANLVANVGGVLGVFLEISCITAYKVFEMLFLNLIN